MSIGWKSATIDDEDVDATDDVDASNDVLRPGGCPDPFVFGGDVTMTGRPSFPVTTVDDCNTGAAVAEAAVAVALGRLLLVIGAGVGGSPIEDDDVILRYDRDDVDGNDE